MKVVAVHAARDLRVEEHAEAAIGARQVEVEVLAGGICGSDLHYYNHGGFGTVRLREAMILGHEVGGVVRTTGAAVTATKAGDVVAVNPSRPCGDCDFCAAGLQNHCRDMRFYGSAMRFPHTQGAFRQRLVADESQCFVLPPSASPALAALAEPFAVALHAAARAGSLLGRRVLITGSGPIGALVAVAARLGGAAEIVATDVVPEPLETMLAIGADRVVNVAADDSGALAGYAAGKGWFDVMFEASGSPQALSDGLATLRPRGILVQIGLGAPGTIPLGQITAKEADLRGTFRFHEEFGQAVEFIGGGRVDLAPLITHTFGVDEAQRAFDTANDRTRAMKVQLAFQ
jgi:L-idonate 5-dehydrogenase